jgi:acetyl-CoA acyltransferase
MPRSRRSTIAQKKGDPIVVSKDEHPARHDAGSAGEAEALRESRTAAMTAGNASGVNDGAGALIVAERGGR